MARGDVHQMQRILREDIPMSPETPEEEAVMKQAREFTAAPFTSFHMCGECAPDASRPAMQISGLYEDLARTIDDDLTAQIAANQQNVGHW